MLSLMLTGHPEVLSLCGLFLFLSGLAGEFFFWSRLKGELSTDMHPACDAALLILSALIVVFGMWVAATGLGVFAHLGSAI